MTPEEFAAEWPGIFHFTGDRYYVKRNFQKRCTANPCVSFATLDIQLSAIFDMRGTVCGVENPPTLALPPPGAV